MSWWLADDPRRRTAVIGATLGAAAVVGLGTGMLIGAAGGGQEPTGAVIPPAVSAPASPPPSASPTTRAASQIEPGTTKDVGYLVASERQSEGMHVTFDRVVFRTGQAARDYAKRYKKGPPDANGVLIVNDNPMTRDLVLSPDVTVLGARALAGTSAASEVTLQTLLDAIASQGRSLLLDLRYDDLGYVTEVREHDLP
jgi:hypothetical protein